MRASSRIIGTKASSQQIISSGLITNLDAGNISSYPGSGTTWTDLSGNNKNATLSNVSYIDGYFSFNGTSSFVDLNWNPAAGASEISVCVWIYPTDLGATRTIYDENDGTYWAYTADLTSYKTRDTSTGPTGARDNDLAITDITLNNWQNVCFTYSVSQSFKKYYRNGSIIRTNTTSIDTLTSSRSAANGGWATGTLGRSGDPSGGLYWLGRMSVLHVYNRALTDQEISTNFNVIRSRYGV